MAGRRAGSVVATASRRPWRAQISLSSQAASGGAKLIGLFALTITACLLPLAEGHNGGSLSGKPTSESSNGVTKKAMQLSYLLPRVHLLLSLQVTAGLEAKVLLPFF